MGWPSPAGRALLLAVAAFRLVQMGRGAKPSHSCLQCVICAKHGRSLWPAGLTGKPQRFDCTDTSFALQFLL